MRRALTTAPVRVWFGVLRLAVTVSPLLKVDDVSLIFWRREGPYRALAEVSFVVKPGDFVVVKGPNGSGKSLLMAISAGLLPPSAGTVWFDGADLYRQPRRLRDQIISARISHIPQIPNFRKRWTLLENMMLGVPGRLRVVVRERMERLIEEFHLTDKMNWRIKELSTGEAQRASVARALALKPDLLIADSPTSLLDEDSAAKVVECLKDYHLRGGTVLAASNDPRIVRLARQVLFLDHGTLVPTPRG